ncbi:MULTISPECIES: SusD/RagB family nutrient-binding outer membrane lipoprotein [unclassified Arenibacter]|jgi:hypothetical protein|uniref:SusD/RagB family nutrient-binding outer membrane lipoprotein n=1 Tax=unclassified Arenibacter TaxID=2615047 RepID=UPI000E357A19|nr:MULTISPECIES: SusD/RagB family nutrient-binding outer membrane lipoprotein [unclassified Arenibacter]MCM4164551.1 hypothetical protein [Arenibacter sp. A80]RFT55635.1 SusD/RagB family nutrient-binding outer membrane lipoprotein [Arenibacter sp. P308M17]
MKTKKNKTNRNMYIVFLCASFLFLSSCDKDFGDINNNYETKLYEATVPGLFNDLVRTTLKTGQHHRIPVAWLYQWSQSAAMFAESGYRLDDNTTEPWKVYYTSLANSREIEKLISENPDAANMTNISAMTKILMAYKTLTTTLLYGDMPYSEAGKGFEGSENFRPVYDSQQSIMESAINDLSAAMDNLSSDPSQVSLGGYDTLLGNDIPLWITFANSLRLRYAMTMIEKNAAFAGPVITDALSKPLLTADEHISLDPASIAGLEINRSDFWRGNSYMRMGSTMWSEMSSTDAVDGSGIYDLRCKIFFEPNESDEWVPYPQNPTLSTPSVTGDPNQPSRITGDWNTLRSNFASFNVYFTEDRTIPQFIITGSQISFIKAEIYNRGLAGVAADAAMAEGFYLEGITASVKFWYGHANASAIWNINKPATAEPTELEWTTMLTDPNVAYSADPETALNQIYKQSWIALFHQQFEAWNLQRRTGNATPNVPLTTSLVNDFNRLPYPPSERETNRINWQAATGGGNDSETTKNWMQQ